MPTANSAAHVRYRPASLDFLHSLLRHPVVEFGPHLELGIKHFRPFHHDLAPCRFVRRAATNQIVDHERAQIHLGIVKPRRRDLAPDPIVQLASDRFRVHIIVMRRNVESVTVFLLDAFPATAIAAAEPETLPQIVAPVRRGRVRIRVFEQFKQLPRCGKILVLCVLTIALAGVADFLIGLRLQVVVVGFEPYPALRIAHRLASEQQFEGHDPRQNLRLRCRRPHG